MFLHVISLCTMQCVTPFYVATSMSGIRRSSFMAPDGVGYTREAVATIGIKRVTYGCLSHTIQVRTSMSNGEKNCISSIVFDLLCCGIVGAYYDRGGSLFSNKDSSPLSKAWVMFGERKKGNPLVATYLYVLVCTSFIHVSSSLPPPPSLSQSL